MEKKGLSGSTLKLLAIITMLIDHTAAVILTESPNYGLYRMIGRVSFPIFCFLLVEGYVHTHDVKRYALRLFFFALLSELPFDLALYGRLFYPYAQNVFFTLLIGLFVLYLMDRTKNWFLKILVVFMGMLIAALGMTDYSYLGILSIAVLYAARENRLKQCFAGAVTFLWEPPAVLAFLPIYFYNGKRGMSFKYFFYIFYPLHLLLLVGIKQLLSELLITWFVF